MTWPPGAHASTFGGNPVSCAAALATIELLREQLVKNAADVGAHLMAGLAALMDKHPLIGDVRGKGLMIVSAESKFLSCDFPEGSPIIPVAPPTRANGLCPHLWKWTSNIIGTMFPICKDDAVGSKPT